MKIAAMGAGAIGGYVGARLAVKGAEVTFIARGRHLAAIREAGFTVQSPAPRNDPGAVRRRHPPGHHRLPEAADLDGEPLRAEDRSLGAMRGDLGATHPTTRPAIPDSSVRRRA
jgi:Ketopantoate reductase PanE/ApbA